jgi:hypothetical protein
LSSLVLLRVLLRVLLQALCWQLCLSLLPVAVRAQPLGCLNPGWEEQPQEVPQSQVHLVLAVLQRVCCRAEQLGCLHAS